MPGSQIGSGMAKAAATDPPDQNPLDLIQADRIVDTVVELGRARRLMGRDLLGVRNCTTVLQVGGDAR
ncbi:MAG: hypothetical protein EHM79_21435 [Geobacter sp.]|nr:MAG: hypothetical protein EHM79_21435 [Geobacter sp.]